MASGATKWVWEHSRATNGSLIVLLAIARECGEGEFTEMSIAQLSQKARLSDKGVRNAVKDLQGLGELSVTPRTGAISRYELTVTPVKTTGVPRQKLPDHPGKNYRAAETTGRKKLPGSAEEPQVNGTPVKTTGVEISNMLLTVTGSPLVPVKDVPAKPPRDDADRLCAHLADKIEANGSKRPVVNAKWRDAARLLIDKDGRTEEQVRAAIDWCQQDEFWRANILSMPKLREKYDQLRMHAMRGRSSTAQSNSNLDVVARYMQRVGNGDGE
jgi:hypothetical protein